jgi:energy-coupling factor transporter ATP-binding protein EcfA2
MRATRPANGETILEAVGLTRSFGGVLALDGYSIRIRSDDLIGLIGPNGAGKATLFNLLSGVLHPDAGRIFWRGTDVRLAEVLENGPLAWEEQRSVWGLSRGCVQPGSSSRPRPLYVTAKGSATPRPTRADFPRLSDAGPSPRLRSSDELSLAPRSIPGRVSS